jgi:hypothetical protein
MTIRPAAVEESIPSVVDTSRTPRSVSFLTGLKNVERVAAQPVQLPHHDGVTLRT